MIKITSNTYLSDHRRSPLKDDVNETLHDENRIANLSPDMSLGKCRRQLWKDNHIVHRQSHLANCEVTYELIRMSDNTREKSIRHRSPYATSSKRSTPIKIENEPFRDVFNHLSGQEKVRSRKTKTPLLTSFVIMQQKYRCFILPSLLLIICIVLIVFVGSVSEDFYHNKSHVTGTFGRHLRAKNHSTNARENMFHDRKLEKDAQVYEIHTYRPFSLIAFQRNLMNFKPPFMAYVVQEGKLYARRQHLEQLKKIDSGNDYVNRVQYIHAMIIDALRMGVRGMENEEGRIQHPEFMEIVGSPREKSLKEKNINIGLSRKYVRPVVLPLLIQFTNNASCSILGENSNDGESGWPFLSWAANAISLNCEAIPVPGYFLWKDHQDKLTSKHWGRIFKQQHIDYPWETKFPSIVWTRQSKTSVEFQQGEVTLLSHSLKHPDLINAINVDSQFQLKHLMRFRAIIDINENHHGSQSFGNLLCSNSLVVKVKPKYVEYYFHEVIPWVHYIPVSADLSDLIKIAHFISDDSNEELMLEIIDNANNFCRKRFTRTRMALDVLKILTSYSEGLDRDNFDWRNQWLNEFGSLRDNLDLVPVRQNDKALERNSKMLS